MKISFKSKCFIFILFLFLLCSCSLNFPFYTTNTTIDVTQKNGVDFQTYRKYLGFHDLPSVGNPKILVIPVVFTDCALSEKQLEEEHAVIENAFFGRSQDTYWESVASFYQKSSYNKLNIEGKVTDYFYYNKSVIQANKVYIDSNIEPTYLILESAIEWYKANNDDLADFDSDNDGYIDSVWLIYMEDYYLTYLNKHPSQSSTTNISDFLWAYTYWYLKEKTSNEIAPFSYAWGSYMFAHDGSDGLPDAHTYIHETGHLLGLDDYYNYDYTGTISGDRTKPIGGMDMMDLNILDHNAYSKYLLKWIDPIIVGSSEEITLSAFQNQGQAIIVPSVSWSGSPLDEYLILELYTPTGLNKLDSENSYCGKYPLGFSKYGVKIYHVDSRLGLFKNSNGLKLASYLPSPSSFNSNAKKGYYMDIVNSNTPSYSYDSKLITLLSATGSNRYYAHRNMGAANNSDLFKDGSALKGFKFHQYNDTNLLIEVDDMSSESCTIKISGVGK